MRHLTIATSQADAAAADVMEDHHAQLVGQLAVRSQTLAALAPGGWSAQVEEARDDLVTWARTQLVPHARAEEETLYAAAAQDPRGRPLVDAMLTEHGVIGDLIDRIAVARDALALAIAAGRLAAVVEGHVAKENDQLLPLLLEGAGTSVAGLLSTMHELLEDSHRAGTREESGGHDRDAATCTCGESDGSKVPELDARAIPHAIRHATIFGALDAVHPGHGMVLIAPHDPLPLLAQVEERSPGVFTVDYLERGPETWRLSLVRAAL